MEYNQLTKDLLAQGYTVENYPDYVKICTSRLTGNDPLNNISGGFVYKPSVRDKFVYKTGCGLHVIGQHTYDMGYLIEWNHENDNPITNCPYRHRTCAQNDERLNGCAMYSCVCHRTNEPYDYDNSVEKEEKEYNSSKEQKYRGFVAAQNGRVCRNHAYWDADTSEWVLRYSPEKCAKECCSQDGFCPILNKKLDKKKGNVYYDLKESYIRNDDTFFSGEEIVSVTKGIRFFKRPVSMDICRAFIAAQSSEIYRKYHWEKETTMQMYDASFKGEIVNIRAESKPSRDLLQDLEDIKNGITIYHESDMERSEKEYKRKKKELAEKKAMEKIRQKIIKEGLDNLTLAENRKLNKKLSEEEISELELLHENWLEEQRKKPVQLDLFGMGMMGA